MSEPLNSPGLLVLLVVVGFGGGFLSGRLFTGGRALVAFLLWLALPVVVLALLLGANTDASLPQDRASYNFALGLGIYSIVVMVPWLPMSVLGFLVGRRFRPKPQAPAKPYPAASRPAPVRPDGLPDWSKADNPRRSLGELQDMLEEKARRGGIDTNLLPRCGAIDGPDGEFVIEDKFDFIYLGLERGQPQFEHSSVIADQLCYYVLKDRALALAANRIAGTPADEYADRLAAEQASILALIDPRWGRQVAYDRQFSA